MSENFHDAPVANSAGSVETVRRRSIVVWIEQLIQDVRFALRQVRKAPGFAAIVIATVGLGIGACTVVFSAVHSTLLAFAFTPTAARMVAIHEAEPPRRPVLGVSPPAFLDLREHAKSFESVEAWVGGSVTLTDGAEPLQVKSGSMTVGMFDDLRGTMTAGRLFAPADYAAGAADVAVITYGFWQRQFGGASTVVGRTVHFDGMPFTIIGVLPKSFEMIASDVEVWMPLIIAPGWRTARARGFHNLGVSGVLKPGVTIDQARAELAVLAAHNAKAYPATNERVGFLVQSMASYLTRFITPMLYILLTTVGCVLLIVCANVANLLLARATARQREISVRAALGANRGRLTRQLLAEAVVLAVAGGALGIGLAEVGLQFVRTFAPSAGSELARLAFVRLDPTMLGFTLLFSMATGVLFGIVPAWVVSRVNLNESLKQGSRGSDHPGRSRLRAVLVIVEVALAMALLASTGLLVRGFRQMSHLDVGYNPNGIVVMQLNLRWQRYSRDLPARVQFTDDLLQHLKTVPGVDAAALTTVTPLNFPSVAPFGLDGQSLAGPGNQPAAIEYAVTPDYFRTVGMRVITGRGFTALDRGSAPQVVVISEGLAKQYFGQENPLGRRLNLAAPDAAESWYDIVGVVNNVMQGGPSEYTPPQLYVPLVNWTPAAFFVLAHTNGDPERLISQLKAQVYAVDREQPILTTRLLADWFNSTIARQRLAVDLLTAFSFIALAIAAVGIYGVMSYSVSQRTSEFGIRMALGATRGNVLMDVLRRGMMVVSIGVAIGLGAALMSGGVLSSVVQDVDARDPLTLLAIVAGLMIVAFLACLLPALRATRVDPMIALRTE